MLLIINALYFIITFCIGKYEETFIIENEP